MDFESSYQFDEIDPLWNLAEDLSIEDAAALIAGYNPVLISRCKNDTNFDQTFSKYPIALKSLTHAITNRRVNASIRHSAREYGYADAEADQEYYDAEFWHVTGSTADEDEKVSKDKSCFFKPFPDWSLSTIARDELVAWLRSRGIKDGFFFPRDADASNVPDYLDPKGARYANKLAAAVHAWQAVTNSGKVSPKKALEKWLREHASMFGMTDDDGNPVNQAIEDCSKVANWRPGGGAPKTPQS
jgi:hypothetical protein